MMKKTRALLLAALLLLAAAGTVSARGFAIGGEGALYLAGAGGLPMSAMLTFHIPQVPLMFGIGVQSPFAIALTADYWAAHGNLVSILSWYAGIGVYGSFDFNGGNAAIGGRIPIGLQAWPLRNVVEIFVEIAPAVGVILVPTGFDWHLQGAIGVRFWF